MKNNTKEIQINWPTIIIDEKNYVYIKDVEKTLNEIINANSVIKKQLNDEIKCLLSLVNKKQMDQKDIDFILKLKERYQQK